MHGVKKLQQNTFIKNLLGTKNYNFSVTEINTR